MAKLHYGTLSFQNQGEHLQVTLLRIFSTKIPQEEVEKIAGYSLPDAHTIEFKKIDQEKAETKFFRITIALVIGFIAVQIMGIGYYSLISWF